MELTHLDLNFVFDVGHANMGEGVEAAFEIMKDRIRSTHVHDNDGKDDKHLFPLMAEGGTVDWKKTMELLRTRADQYPLLLELKKGSAGASARVACSGSLRPAGEPVSDACTNHHRRCRAARRRNRADRRLAVQPAQVRQDRVPASCATARA